MHSMIIMKRNEFVQLSYESGEKVSLASLTFHLVLANLVRIGCRKRTVEEKMARSIISILFFSFAFFAFSNALNDGSTLVLVDNLAIRETHSIFFKSLQGLLA